MKLLILTQYFPPEVGAPQNRLFELAIRLQKLGIEITVLTAMPNYPQMQVYEGYRDLSYKMEDMSGLKVHRSSIFVSQSKSILNRLRNYFSFVVSSARSSSRLDASYDFLLCESPPLFLGYSALYLSRKKKARLIFNVSDLWPESAEKLGVVTNKFLLSLAYRLEARLYQRSALVTGQTKGICTDIHKRFPGVKTYWLPNGVDLAFYDPTRVVKNDWRNGNGLSPTDFVLIYAGIIGIAQGLEVVLSAASMLKDRTEIKFVLLGSGPEKSRLRIMASDLSLHIVLFLDPVTKSQMPGILSEVDMAMIPLRKLELFTGAIPSKIFETLAMQVPVLLGVQGEAKQLFIDEAHAGIYVEPENADDLKKSILQAMGDKVELRQMGINGRRFVTERFNREKIAADFYQQLKAL